MISRYGLMRCTLQANRYYVQNTVTTTTTRPFSGLLWPHTTKGEKSACAPDQRCAPSGFVHDTRSQKSNSCEEETDKNTMDNQFRLNITITYPWIAHRGHQIDSLSQHP